MCLVAADCKMMLSINHSISQILSLNRGTFQNILRHYPVTFGDVIDPAQIILIAQIIAFRNFENYGSIKSMKKSILLFNYRNFPKILLVARKYYCLSDLIKYLKFNINVGGKTINNRKIHERR